MTKKKKIIVLSCMVALLLVTAVFNFVMTSATTNVSSVETTSTDYFTEYRNERITTRNEELMQLNEIIEKAEVKSSEYNSALSLKQQLTSITEKELLLENLIKAYGFEDVVVVIGLESENVNVVAKTVDLTQDDAIKIYTIIQEEKISTPERVKIIPIS